MSYQDVRVLCGNCGSDATSIENPAPDDLVTCAGCGASDRFEDVLDSVNDHMLQEATAGIASALSTGFKRGGFDGFKPAKLAKKQFRWTSTVKLEV